MDDLIGEFISETSESLAVLDRELGRLTQHPGDTAVLGAIARLVHTIKGTCGFLGLPRLEAVADAAERVLGHARGGKEDEAIALVLEALERIRGLIGAISTQGHEPEGDDRDLLARLARFTSGGAAPAREQQREPMHAFATATTATKPRPMTFAQPLDALPAVLPPIEKTEQAVAPRREKPARPLPLARGMGAQLLRMASELVETRNQLLTLMRRGAAELDAPVRQLTQMIGALQKQIEPGLVDRQAIMRVMVMEAAGRRFAMAQTEMHELVRIGEGSPYKVEMVGNAWLLRLRERLLPLMTLSEILQLSPVRADVSRARGYAAVMRVGGMDFGLVVDALHDPEELVVQPLSHAVGALPMYRGMSLLGDGSIVLLLDANGVGEAFGARGGAYRPSDDTDLTQVEYLLFHAGADAPKAVALSQVVRLESFEARMVENGHVRYQGALLPLALLPGMMLPRSGMVNVIVLRHQEAQLGLVVERAADIAMAPPMKKFSARTTYYLGSAMLAGAATEVVDIDYLAQETREAA